MDKKELKSEELQDPEPGDQERSDEGDRVAGERDLGGGPENIPVVSVLQQEILKTENFEKYVAFYFSNYYFLILT